MLKWMHRLRLPLAAKTLLAFGLGLGVVLSAALWVPWRRMEQLTQQINERAAAAVVVNTIGEHARHWSPTAGDGAATRPAQQRWDRDVEPQIVDGERFLPPRLIPLTALRTPEKLTRFDVAAFQAFIADPQKAEHWRYFNGGYGYRYARPFYAEGECLQCHSAAATAAVAGELFSPDRFDPDANEDSSRSGVEPPLLALSRATTQPTNLLGIVSVEIPSQIERQQLLLNRITMISAGLIAGLMAVIVFYFIAARLILQPVRVLQDTCERVSQGDLNIRSDVNTGDEFQQLSETFNVMLRNLQDSADQLRAVNKSLDLKLGQLAETNVALYESNRLKSEFLANVSHELRTPLNSILGFANLLRDSDVERDAKSQRYLNNIVSAGNNLLNLINELLDLAKIEAGRMEVRPEPLSLGSLFEGLASVLKPLTEKKALSIVTRVSNDVPIIQTDGPKLQQILYNFLSNAIKFSPHGASIDLSAEREGLLSVRISVRDRGPGVAAEMQQVIFEKFRQLDGSHTREHGGTGLGLAIARELAQLLGGSVGVHSEAGEGATFYLLLPLKIDAGPRDVREKLVLT